MKFFIAVVALAICCSSTVEAREKQDFLAAIAKECSEEIGYDLDSAMKLLGGDFSVRSKKAQCFVNCFFKKEGFVSEDNKFLKEHIVEVMLDNVKISHSKLTAIVERCTRHESENACDDSFQFLECLLADKYIFKGSPHDDEL